MPSSIDDLRALGYRLGIAQGSVAAEEEALAAAQADAEPSVILEQTNTITSQTIEQIRAQGALPDTPEGRLEIAQQIAATALEQLTERANGRVEFHQRALAIAREMPDVWRVEQRSPETGAMVVSLLVATTDAGVGVDETQQEILDALADPDGYAERAWFGDNPDAVETMQSLAAAGIAVSRPAAGADEFEAEGSTYTKAGLADFLAEVWARPKPPTTQEKVAAALANVSELSAASKQALLDALA